MDPLNLEKLSDEAVLARLKTLTRAERKLLPHLLACLAETDRRGAYKKPGFSSLFEYCTLRLRYSEDAAYRRIHAARAAACFPQIYSHLADGSLSLSVVSKLAPRLTAANAADLLGRAQGKGKRAVEEMLAGMFPCPDTADRIRALRIPTPLRTETPLENLATAQANPSQHPTLAPVSGQDSPSDPQLETMPLEASTVLPGDRFQFSFTGSGVLRAAIERAKDILWHKYPGGRLEEILLEALRDYLERHDPRLRLKIPRQRLPSRGALPRTIPAWVRSKIWARDGGRCSYVAPDGWRCRTRRGLELDHLHPRTSGGRSDDPGNIRLLCRAHNDCERRRLLGEGTRPDARAPGQVIHRLGPGQVGG